jgi:hypothetical protein
MKTAKQREADFRADLKALLDKHKAELNITDDGGDYGMQQGVAEVTMISEWDKDGNQTAEFTEFWI